MSDEPSSQEEPAEAAALRQALSFSPENVALRKHLADTLARLGRQQAAIIEYRTCLASSPEDELLQAGLANAFFQNQQLSEALVMVEDRLDKGTEFADFYILHVKLLIRSGDLALAAVQYKKALDMEPSTRNSEFDETLASFMKPPSGSRDPRRQAEIPAAERLDEEAPYDDGYGNDEFDQRLKAGDIPSEAFVETEKPRIGFDDVGGMDEVKKQIRLKMILPMQQPELYKAYGKQAGGGVLMYGPPGCGKTHLARASAGEIDSSFMPIGIHEVLDMYIGQSERNLHALFEQARNNKPCVLFFDEVDALGASRTDMKQSAGRQMINQFLDELDGVRSSNEDLLVLAATNAPWHLDAAFRRPGRFDRIIFVPPPDEAGRAKILELLLADKPVEDINIPQLVKKTHNFSGADLKATVDGAIESKLERAAETGEIDPIRTRDLLAACKRIKPSVKEWFATAKNYALYSNESGHYDEILDYMNLR